MSFSNYRADSFIDLLNKRVDELNYKIVLALEQLEVIKKFLMLIIVLNSKLYIK
jgi:hypothetical protein